MADQQTGLARQKDSGASSDAPIIPVEEILKGLLLSLERGWYDNFDASAYHLMPFKPGSVRAEARFLEIDEVPRSADDEKANLMSSSMQNVISSLRDGSHGLVYALSSMDGNTNLFTGVRHFDRDVQTDEYVNILHQALRSNYPGIVFKEKEIPGVDEKFLDHRVPFDVYKKKLLDPVEHWDYLSCVTGIPSLRDTDRYTFSQSIDRLVDALQGETYLLMVVAEPIQDLLVSELITKLRDLGSKVSKMVRFNISENRSEQQTITDTLSEGGTVGLAGFFSAMLNKSTSIGTSVSVGKQVSAEQIDKHAEFCVQLINHYIERLQLGRGLGFWNAGVYLASPNHSTMMRAQSMARSLYSGEKTHYEPIRILDLSESDDAKNAIKNLRVPVLADLGKAGKHPLGELYQSLGTPITTEELSILTSFPVREVPGLKIKPVVDFNLNPPRHNGAELGTLLYRGTPLKTRISISAKSLTRHTFVTGLTGSGKTNSCLALLTDAYKNNGLNFLVIDPAKYEYRSLMQYAERANATKLGKEVRVFTLGSEDAPFRLNPFEFERGFGLLTHIDLLKSVFNAAFPMYASMPYLLEEAIFEIYRDKGWDIKSSTNRFISDTDLETIDFTPYLPCLTDLYAKIDTVVASKRYDQRLQQDLTAALKTRIGSLRRGHKGAMLDCYKSIGMDFLLNNPVVLELSGIGDDDEKSFVIALLFIRLYEAAKKREPDGKLHHITLIEEAHRLLRNVPTVASAESANPRGKTIEMFTDMMAEMRAHGEGFIIVDQMPGKLVPDVVKGSNLKIVHRLLAQDDRESVGTAMGLRPAQIDFLPRLMVGQAVVHSEELGEACLVKIDPVEDRLREELDDKSRKALVRKRFGEFKQTDGHQQIYQRFPSCKNCANPCEFHPERNGWAPTDNAVLLGQRLVYALVVGTSGAVRIQLDQLHNEVDNVLKKRYQTYFKTPTKDHIYCAYVHLSLCISAWLYQTYRYSSKASLLKLEQLLIDAFLQEGNINMSLQREIQTILVSEIMKVPAKDMVGCSSCLSPCLFGPIFQDKENAAVKALSKSIDTQKKQGESPTYKVDGTLKNAVQKYMDFELNPQLLNDAAYCWVVNSTTDSIAYSKFWEDKH